MGARVGSSVSDQDKLARQTLKLVRFCTGGVAKEKTSKAIVLTAPDGKTSRVASSLLSAALRAGLLVDTKDGLRTSDTGLSFARRALAGAGLDGDVICFQSQPGQIEMDTVTIDGKQAVVARNMAESPLAAIARMKGRDGQAFLSGQQREAGERLSRDFVRGHMQPRISANWEASVASSSGRSANGAADISDSAMAARQRIDRAVQAIGPELSGVVLDVCCFEKGLELVERERQWPARSAKIMLRSGLSALSRHYGFTR
ncbi:hypothetical protein D5400_16660 [Georhizobium profundi]|uniref:DUF6456 domain-containing protein n=1 Tax=Georhizobium profundi TaxID=2341112 RepID=A0A3Q8XPY3_9HYPH|nr:hypothetical protein D5400_16660 [Georhizobium profundi]